MVRNLWAYGHTNVFFVVAGPWEDIQSEFEAYGDLIWIDRKEIYRGLVWKTITIFIAFERNLKNYRHILKTDDDTYVRLNVLERKSAVEHRETDYWGECKNGSKVVRDVDHRWYVSPEDYAPETFPNYAMGGGYLLSKEFARCAVEKAHTFALMPIEDAQTGAFAEACGVQCERDLSIQDGGKLYVKRKLDYTIKYNTFAISMIGYHYDTCGDDRLYDKSCAGRVVGQGDERVVAFPRLF